MLFLFVVPFVGLMAHETNPNVDKPAVAPIHSAHYEIWSIDGAESAKNAGKVLEQLRQDFADTFVGRIGPRLPTQRLTALLVRDKLDNYPGVYDPVNKWAVVDLALCKFPKDKWATILRHEATHQLFNHTYKIPVVRGDNSFWYREGMACYFEGGGQYRLNGPVRLMRLGMLEAAFKEDVLPPIADVVRRQPGNLGGGNSAVDYALAWSFVHFLMHGKNGQYREQFFGFLENISGWNQQLRGSQVFLASFPDLDVLHRDWSLHVALLQRGDESRFKAELKPIGRVAHQAPDEASRELIPKVEAAEKAPAPSRDEIRAAYNKMKEIFLAPRADWVARLETELFEPRNGMPSLQAGYSLVDTITRKQVLDAIKLAHHRPSLPFLIRVSLRESDAALRQQAAGLVRDFTYGIAPKVYFDMMRGQGPEAMQRVVEALDVIGDPYATKYLIALLTSVGSRIQPGTRSARSANSFSTGNRTVIRPGVRTLSEQIPQRLLGRNPAEQQMAEATIATLQKLTGETMSTKEEWLAWATRKRR